ncbi:putative oxidoreductase YdhV [Sporotomaculum syntrophicum]|uniref:Oxidoreductase YdhV n=1 Tax=Sporotomaculum syntrophicum TaxID=182264 RepID=A0A9D3AZ73_9FIRM|nr:aldehyde ferredoxin oxidoreductase C-terminal domain-containing protein [Sporotomaculum syntrophicum]KAF1085528.1 putative oxidoreductase YdhV [Sporotomaculum syntrophicum]
MNGWFDCRLRVDLSSGSILRESIGEQVLCAFIGGRGLNDWVLLNEVPPDCDPLASCNVLCFAPGPLTGTSMPMNSRCHVSTIGPHSNILGDGNGGNRFPFRMKLSGLDQIVITGQSDHPVYLWIDNDTAELRDAAALWGMDTWQCTDTLREKHGSDIGVACIGQAGENFVRFASIIFDRFGSAARGAGAVMGSKKLKAIAVRGNKQVALADAGTFKQLADEDRHFFLTDPFQKGTVSRVGTHHGLGAWFPGWHNNAKYLAAEEVPEQINTEAWAKYQIKRTACNTCPSFCKEVFQIPDGPYAGEVGSALEYDSIHCLGINCGIEKPTSIMVMQNLADKYGMCTIPLGNNIAFAKDLYSRGIIGPEDVDGLDLSWENDSAQIELIHRIALRQGFGSVLAEGEIGAPQIIGRDAYYYNDQVKGTGRGHFPPGMFALAHATSTRGADHLRGRSWAYGENDGDLFPKLIKQGYLPSDEMGILLTSEEACALNDSLGRCKGSVNAWVNAIPLVWKYPLYAGLSRVLKAATGISFSEEDLSTVGKRVYLLEMAINARRGVNRAADRLVQRPELLNTPEGKQQREQHDAMLTEYYKRRGCNTESGIPARTALEKVGLTVVADILEAEPARTWSGPPLWPLSSYPTATKSA